MIAKPENQNLAQAASMQQQHQQLTSQLPFRRAYYKTLRKGSLAYCQYTFWRHDPNPLILVTDVLGDRIRGVNLHYLTFKYVQSLIDHYCGKMHFAYSLIKNDPYIVNAFRTYKKAGLRKIQLLDCDTINMQFQQQRRANKYNPQELKAIKDNLRQQMQGASNMNADDMANQYTQSLGPNPGLQGTIQPRPATLPNQSATQPGI